MIDRLIILEGDAVKNLRTLATGSVQCVVTSPPYWGLRDYGTAAWEGGEAGCDHRPNHNNDSSRLEGGKDTQSSAHLFRGYCGKCGAKRIDSQLGLEKTPDEYVAKMVEVFREVRRVLRKDGTLWLNLGDSYVHGIPGAGSVFDNGRTDGRKSHEGDKVRGREKISTIAPGLKVKDLCGIPWRVAFALQADGWWLRSDIIWAKPNPMPESVTDRPTKSHEYLFLLTKSANYFYDAEAIKERYAECTINDSRVGVDVSRGGIKDYEGAGVQNPSDVRARIFNGLGTGRNKRSVWTVATAPYPEAHFATYPPDLIKPCIMAGSRVGDTILDPFAGSGTTGMVALELGRKAVLIELNPSYCDLIRQRTDVTPGLQLA